VQHSFSKSRSFSAVPLNAFKHLRSMFKAVQAEVKEE
jgi:hypothetical protein